MCCRSLLRREETHRERYHASYDARGAFVVFLEVFEVVPGFFCRFYEQFLVVEADSEAFGYRPSEGAPSAAEAAAYRYYVSLW